MARSHTEANGRKEQRRDKDWIKATIESRKLVNFRNFYWNDRLLYHSSNNILVL